MNDKNNKVKNIINQINSSDAIILEGAISILSALYSDYSDYSDRSDHSKILKIIFKQNVKNKNTQKILTAAKIKNIEIEFFSPDEMLEFEEAINNTGLYSLGKTHGGMMAITLKRRFLTKEVKYCRKLSYRGKSSCRKKRLISPASLIPIPYRRIYAEPRQKRTVRGSLRPKDKKAQMERINYTVMHPYARDCF